MVLDRLLALGQRNKPSEDAPSEEKRPRMLPPHLLKQRRIAPRQPGHGDDDPVLEAYMHLPDTALPELDVADFRYILNRAILRGSRTALEMVSKDLPLVVRDGKRADFILTLLTRATHREPLDASMVRSLLEQLHETETSSATALTPEAITRLVPLAMLHPGPDSPQLSGAYETLAGALINSLPDASSVQSDGTSLVHNRTFKSVSQLLLRLCHNKREQQVLELLSTMVRMHKVPSSVLQDVMTSLDAKTGPSSDAFRTIVTGVFIKAWLHWQLHVDAAELFIATFPKAASFEWGLDVLQETLRASGRAEVKAASDVLRALLLSRRGKRGGIPDQVFHRFYEQAHTVNCGYAAEKVYAFASASSSKKARYPPPQGVALLWFLRHLLDRDRNPVLARSLAWQIIDNDIHIPLQQRGDLVYTFAHNSIGLPARVLWEKYSVGRDGSSLRGNAAAMLRIVSLYTSLAKKAAAACSPLDGPSSAPALDEQDAFALAHERPPHADLLPKPYTEVPSTHQARDAAIHTESSHDGPSPLSLVLDRDYAGFAERVLNAFREAKEPLEEAPHNDLTSLARAYIMVGKAKEGFRVMGISTARKELPDMYDVNVALSAIGEQTPREAARMLRTLREQGLQPDAVTVGTVLVHAMKHDDLPLVQWLVSWARWLENDAIHLRTINAVVRGSLTLTRKEGEGEALRKNLERCWEVVNLLLEEKYVPTPSTGKFCARAALDAGSVMLAFRFWRALVRGKEGRHQEDATLRGDMAVAIRTMVDKGTMHQMVGRKMLRTLGQES